MHVPASSRVLITGASSGIGLAAARLLAARGHEVGILSNEREQVEEAVAELRARGDRAFPVHADLSIAGEVQGLFGRLEREHGPIDVLVNNAGIGLQADVLVTQEEDLRRLFEVNYFATFILSRDALRCMAPRRRGAIVNVSSASARRALPGMSVYASTKAAMHSLSQALRVEAREHGVSVTELLPMSVRTPFFERATNRSEAAYEPSGWTVTPERVAELVLRAIEYPAPEIYTSTLVRLAFLLDAISPRLVDAVLTARRQNRR